MRDYTHGAVDRLLAPDLEAAATNRLVTSIS